MTESSETYNLLVVFLDILSKYFAEINLHKT